MAQIRKLQAGGLPTSPPTTDSPKEPQLFTVGNTEYNMDTYIRELENNFEGWLDSTNFSDKEKNEQRRLLPIFVQKLRSGVVTPLEGGGWRDSSLEMYNEKKGHDKWGALAWFATEGLRHQKPYNPNASSVSKDAVEYDPNKGLESLRSKIFGPSVRTFISLDDFTDNTNTKRGLKNRSGRVFNALTDIRGNLDKYFTFKNPADRTDLENKIDYILGTVIGDETAGTGNGLIDPNEHFYLSEIGLGDVTDLFATDFTKPSTSQQGNTGGGGGGNDGTVVPPPGGDYLSYGNSFSSEIMSTWLTRAGDTYKVKKTPGITNLSFGNLKLLNANNYKQIERIVTSYSNLNRLSSAIREYFYNRKPGDKKVDELLGIFNGNKDIVGVINLDGKVPYVVRAMLEAMIANNSLQLESIGGNKYILPRTRSKSNVVLMYDSTNGILSEVSAFYSPSFRQNILNRFSSETGIIPTNIDWYSGYYKQGGVLIAQGGTLLNFYDLKNKYYLFSDDVTGDENLQLQWNNELGKYVPISLAGLDAGLTGITKSILDKTFSNYTTFNNLRNLALLDPNNKYISFNPDKGVFSYLSSNKNKKGEILPNTWEINSIGNPGWAKGSLGWRLNKSKNDFSFDSPFDGDEMYQGDFNDQAALRKWIIETNDPNSGYKGIYHSGNNWYRTKNTPMTGNLLTASITNPWIMGTKQDELETLTQGPSNFDKFMLFFGPAVGDVAAGIFTHLRNNAGLEKLKAAMHPNLKTLPNEVYDPLNINYGLMSNGYLRGVDIEHRARENAANFTDPNLALAASRLGTLDRAANDASVDATINQDLQQQILARTAAQNTRNALAAQTAFENQSENNRVELAKATAEVENDKTNTEVWNKIMAKYASQVGDYFTSNVTKKQELADTANKLNALAWLDQTLADEKSKWLSRNTGASESQWLLSPEYRWIKTLFNRMLALGPSYVPTKHPNSGGWPYTLKNGGVLSLRTQALLNKIIK